MLHRDLVHNYGNIASCPRFENRAIVRERLSANDKQARLTRRDFRPIRHPGQLTELPPYQPCPINLPQSLSSKKFLLLPLLSERVYGIKLLGQRVYRIETEQKVIKYILTNYLSIFLGHEHKEGIQAYCFKFFLQVQNSF